MRSFSFLKSPKRTLLRAVGPASWLERSLLASFGVKGRRSEETFVGEPLPPLHGPRGLPQQNSGLFTSSRASLGVPGVVSEQSRFFFLDHWFFFFLNIYFLPCLQINLFIYLFLAALGLCCCAQAFSSCGELGATLRCGARASHCGGFSCCGAGSLGARASVVVARGLSGCGSRALERRLSSCGTRA